MLSLNNKKRKKGKGSGKKATVGEKGTRLKKHPIIVKGEGKPLPVGEEGEGLGVLLPRSAFQKK